MTSFKYWIFAILIGFIVALFVHEIALENMERYAFSEDKVYKEVEELYSFMGLKTFLICMLIAFIFSPDKYKKL